MLRRLPARRRAWGVLRPGRTQQRPWVASTSMVVTLSDAARTATHLIRVEALRGLGLVVSAGRSGKFVAPVIVGGKVKCTYVYMYVWLGSLRYEVCEVVEVLK